MGDNLLAKFHTQPKNLAKISMKPLNMPEARRICIIGPDPDAGYLGGVATHVRNLLKLSAFRQAVVYDLGSLNQQSCDGIFFIFRRLWDLRCVARHEPFSVFFVNSSIYSFSFLKTLLTLMVLPTQNASGPTCIHVYFHGGSFASLPPAVTMLGKLLSCRLFRKVSAFHFLTTQQREGFDQAFPNNKSRTFSNYSNSNSTLPRIRRSSSKLNILFVGRIVRSKGVFELLEAYTKLFEDEGELVHLCFVGDGEDILELKMMAQRLPPSAVEFTGTLDSNALEMVYSASDVLVLPSYAEAFPYVAIEAMQAGLPLIGTSVGALDSLIKDGLTGYKVRVKDSDSIVAALRKVLADPCTKDVMARNCQQFFLDNLSMFAADLYYTKLTTMPYEQLHLDK